MYKVIFTSDIAEDWEGGGGGYVPYHKGCPKKIQMRFNFLPV